MPDVDTPYCLCVSGCSQDVSTEADTCPSVQDEPTHPAVDSIANQQQDQVH